MLSSNIVYIIPIFEVMFPEKLHKKLNQRVGSKSLRNLVEQSSLVDFSSNDYLGFAKSEAIFKQTHKYLVDNGFLLNGATGSRLLTGNHQLYIQVENLLSQKHHTEALLYNSGYDANLGFFSCVPQRHDVILYDEFSHASIRDGIKLSLAKAYAFKHNDLADLEKKLLSVRTQSRANDTEVYIVTESVFSMDGDSPDLVETLQISKKYNAHLIVDEAHAIGVFNFGLVQELSIEKEVFARIITFGKALGCHGAAILGSKQLKNYLINFSRAFIYTTGLSPHSVATLQTVYNCLIASNQTQQELHDVITYFKTSCKTLGLESRFIESHSAIQSCIIPGTIAVKHTAKLLQDNGFDVKPILSPTVPEGQERLRFCIHSYNTHKEIDEVLNLLSTFVNA
ncbi:MAG: aminotransferase class I/II-fold pyridoxal phosphate-dependent enzyme [Flavobacteriaceae bacterium]